MPPSKRRRGKQSGKSATYDDARKSTGSTTYSSSITAPSGDRSDGDDLILTSEKRKGVYECDYCRADISQVPRVRSAVCLNFDLCLDCLMAPPVRGQEGPHDPSKHGYRVCDSTRYPLFPTGRALQTSSSKAMAGQDEDDDNMDVDGAGDENGDDSETGYLDRNSAGPSGRGADKGDTANFESKTGELTSDILVFQPDDRKAVWTVEEDLRLLEGIKMHGLANWGDIAEVVSGQGPVGKTPRKCMERYWDDFLGRYGQILPPYTLVAMDDENNADDEDTNLDDEATETSALRLEDGGTTPSRTSKRRAAQMRTPGATGGSGGQRKKYRVVSTESLVALEELWPDPSVPAGKLFGEEVGRDQSYKSEQSFVKTIANLQSLEKVAKIRQEWEEKRLLKPGGPTALPMRPDDVMTLPGAELAGFMPRRGDFDVEWENEAEQAIADMEFLPGEPEADIQLKLQVLQIYNSKLDEREQRKQFILKRRLYDYKKRQAMDQKLPRDERDLVHRMRLFERFLTPVEHEKLLADILRAKRLRKEIAKLQMYRRMGIKTMVEAEKYELDKHRHTAHVIASQSHQKEKADTERKERQETTPESVSLWKQYRSTTDRKGRKSINRGSISNATSPAASLANLAAEKSGAPKKDVATPSGYNMDVNEGSTPGVDKSDPKTALVSDNGTKSVDTEKAPDVNGGNSSKAPMTLDEIKAKSKAEWLSDVELDLCHSCQLEPSQYLEIKRAIIQQSVSVGLADHRRNVLITVETEKRGTVMDFCVRAGWVSPQVGQEILSAETQTEQT